MTIHPNPDDPLTQPMLRLSDPLAPPAWPLSRVLSDTEIKLERQQKLLSDIQQTLARSWWPGSLDVRKIKADLMTRITVELTRP